MIELICVLLPFLFGAVVFLVPAVLDLVIRDERVPLWYPAPLLLALPALPFVLLIPAVQPEGMGRALVAHASWATFHTAIAGALLVLAGGLAFSRGLRPGGSTLRRRRTSAVAILGLLGLLVAPWMPGLWPLLWVTPACWAGLFWVVALNRRGPGRLERGKSAAASYLYASALSFAIAAAHGMRIVNLDRQDLTTAQWVGVLIGAAVLLGGFRVLSGPPDAGPILVAAASGLSLVIPALYAWSFDPVPDDVEPPEWTDFGGRAHGDPELVERARCVSIHRADGTESRSGDCSYWVDTHIVDRRVALTAIPPDLEYGLMVDDGHFQTPRWGRFEATIVVSADAEGHARLELGAGYGVNAHLGNVALEPSLAGPHPLDAAFSDVLREATGTDRHLVVVASEHWTAQDFVSMCASLTAPASCELVRAPPDSWP
jgi:hypothetical protein